MGRVFRRIQYWLRQRQMEADLAEELETHRRMKQRDLERDGMSRPDAALTARREIGSVTLAREASRAVWVWPWLESVWQDAADAVRALRRQPSVALIAILALATAIGLDVSLFTVFNVLTLQPWPVRDPGRVVTVFAWYPRESGVGGFSLAEYRYVAEHAHAFSGLVAMRDERVDLGFEAVGQRTRGTFVSDGFFDAFGIQMERGRGFLPADGRGGALTPVVVLSYRLWQSHFGGDERVIGQQLRVDDVPATVVGVASRAFTGNGPALDDLWIPFSAWALLHANDPVQGTFLSDPKQCCSEIAGRLAPGVSRAQAQVELALLHAQFQSQFALDPTGLVVTGTSQLARPNSKLKTFAPVLALALCGVTFALLLACANVGNVLLARAAARGREIGVRLSLGASRARVVRQLLTESLVLACVAAAIGTALAYRLPNVLFDRIGQPAPFQITPDGTVLAYALAVAALACLAFGLAPALHATRGDITAALKDERGWLPARLPIRSVFLAVQVSASIVLLVAASLLVRGLQHARTQDPGFAVGDVAVVSIELPSRAYDAARSRAFFAQLARACPEVSELRVCGLARRAPFAGASDWTFVRLPGQGNGQPAQIHVEDVSAGYFEVLRIPVAAGRNFGPADADRGAVLINESMARRYWPGASAIGRTFVAGTPREIIGVVKDAFTAGPDRSESTIFQPFSGGGTATLLVRTTSSAHAARAAEALVRRLDPRVRIQVASLSDSLERLLAPARGGASLAGFLGAFALTLATIGMFGVFAYVVQQRTREIGVRMALGAQPAQVVRLVLAGNTGAVIAGLGVGLVGAIAASQVLRRYLYGVSPFDPLAYTIVAAILAVAALAASYLPVRRAVRIDPVTALRYQ